MTGNRVPSLASISLAGILWFDFGCVGFDTLLCGSARVLWFNVGSVGLLGLVCRLLASDCLLLCSLLFFALVKAGILHPPPPEKQWRMAGEPFDPIHLIYIHNRLMQGSPVTADLGGGGINTFRFCLFV